MERTYNYATEHQLEIYNFFKENGVTKASEKYGLSKVRIYQIAKRVDACNEKEEKMGELFGLSTRTYNALLRNGIGKTKAELKNAYYDGRLKEIKQLGSKALDEIKLFLQI